MYRNPCFPKPYFIVFFSFFFGFIKAGRPLRSIQEICRWSGLKSGILKFFQNEMPFNHPEEVSMKVIFRFPNLVIWGSVVLLLLVITGCSLPSGSAVTEPGSDPPSREAPDDENSEDRDQAPGGNQEAPDDEDGEDGGQTPGTDQEAPDDNGNGGDEDQTPGGNQETPDDESGEDGESGFLSWNIDYPEEKVWGAALTVSLKIDEDTFIPYKHFDLTGTENRKVSLPSGTYRVESRFLSHNAETGSTETVYIYPGLETEGGHVGIPGTVFPDPVEFSSAGALKEYLDSRPENTSANPYPVKITGADLSSAETKGETLKTLYNALGQRYVTLDLRDCTGTELIAASMHGMPNRANIVSLVLPDSVIEINSNGFSGYTNLKSVVMPKVKTLNTSAFKDCGQLESVFSPELETIADAKNNTTGAFVGCTALTTLYFPGLVTMGKYAVYGCNSLTEAAFPNLRTVGGLAFKQCTALKSVSLPAVTRIDSSGFEEDTALMYLVFGANPPELETLVFRSTSFSQDGIIYVPSGAIDSYKNTDHSNWTNLKNLVKPLPDTVVL
jgi:hypothetical protein